MSATRTLTCGALDAGEKPAVPGNICKAYLTESMRQVISDAMDIRAGSAIQRGPRNTLARAWDAVPIGITVEGANILTRSMIIYGQGAIRCHPFVQKEIHAIGANDLAAFDKAIFGHVNLFVDARDAREAARAGAVRASPARRTCRTRSATTSIFRASAPRSRSPRTSRWARSADR